MTPEEARRLLDGTTPGPWGVEYDHDWAIGISAPEGIVFGPYYDQEEMEQWETGSDADLRLAAHAPDMAAMVAGMREEWGVQVLRSGEWQYSRGEDDFRWQDLAVQMVRTVRDHPGEETRLVRRYVTTPEEIS